MKKLILTLGFIVIANLQGFAQDPELYKTWSLRILRLDLADMVIEDISPPIFPTLTITETLSFSGESACNTFTGTMSYNSATTRFEVLSFERTFNTCIEQAHENFDILYLEFFEVGRPAFQAYVSDDGNGEQTLETIGAWYPHLNLKNVPLTTAENDKLNIAVYPNPAVETLFISSEGITIEKINVYSMSGKEVLSVKTKEKSIDVSNLSEGLYFIEVSSPEGKSVQKFVKE